VNQTPEIAFRVERGDPTPEELAAVVAVLAATGTEAEPSGPPARSAWAEQSRLPRRVPSPGPGAWRRSALPG
jgi:hypothetical protein